MAFLISTINLILLGVVIFNIKGIVARFSAIIRDNNYIDENDNSYISHASYAILAATTVLFIINTSIHHSYSDRIAILNKYKEVSISKHPDLVSDWALINPSDTGIINSKE